MPPPSGEAMETIWSESPQPPVRLKVPLASPWPVERAPETVFAQTK